MENLCVTFETWTIADGNYDPFHKGQKVSFALNIQRDKIRRSIRKQYYLKQQSFSDYSFCGEVICNYSEEQHKHMANDNFIVIDTGLYKFFMHKSGDAYPYQVGEFVVGKGQIAVDYFIWGEQSYKIENLPDIYYDFIIGKILYIQIPQKFLTQGNGVLISPTSLSSAEYTDVDIVEIENMAEHENSDENNEEEDNNEDCEIMHMSRSFCVFELERLNT
jgi:hypothetical protein